MRCVMDTSDPAITFDENGVCNHCREFDEVTSKRWFPDEEGTHKLNVIIEKIKNDGADQEYDCIIGLSGGVDSSYLALMIKDYGLRPLVVHVDAGWNSELAVYNIEQIVKHCGYDLYTHVVDWEEMRDLQLAYLRAGVANQDVPQDHIFFSSLYHFAVENKIKYVISGGNIATEGVFPVSWHHSAMDATNLHAIHRRYGKVKLKNYKTINVFQYYLYYPFVYRMKTVRPLNFMVYNKAEALKVLQKKVGYKEYGRKHGESVFTRFFQNHYLPIKFGYDKRRPHLSSMILSGQLSREDGLQELEKPLYDERELKDDLTYIAKKLQITVEELTDLIDASGVDATIFKNWDGIYNKLKSVQGFAESLLGRGIKNYA
jgi:N-acetyl sugar amidotransferase